MTMSLADIKAFPSIDLDIYEVRGIKYGINNARSTGTAYVDGQYIPASNKLQSYGVFTASDTTVKGIGFYPPYASFNASKFVAGDVIQFDGTSLSVAGLVDATSISLTEAPDFSGTKDFTSVWGFREYLVEPDVGKNTLTGNAFFTNGSKSVTGVSTFWLGQIVPGDFFKSDAYQKNYIVDTTVSNTALTLTAPYDGPTTAGPSEPYTAKKRQLNRMSVEYVKDDFHYEKNGGIWVK
jgi:hypothetical protein